MITQPDSTEFPLAGRFVAAFNDARFEEAMRLFAADARIVTPMTEIWNEAPRGREGIRRWLDRISREFSSFEIVGYSLEHTGDWISGQALLRARGKASPEMLEYPVHCALLLVGQEIVEAGLYLTDEEATAAIERGAV